MWLRANAWAARLAFRFVDENFDSLPAPESLRREDAANERGSAEARKTVGLTQARLRARAAI
jgi:hypothetical protein